MKGKMIWVAQHPDHKDVYKISLSEPEYKDVLIESWTEGDDVCVEWKRYVMFEVDDE